MVPETHIFCFGISIIIFPHLYVPCGNTGGAGKWAALAALAARTALASRCNGRLGKTGDAGRKAAPATLAARDALASLPALATLATLDARVMRNTLNT